jgi:hypothetical protein
MNAERAGIVPKNYCDMNPLAYPKIEHGPFEEGLLGDAESLGVAYKGKRVLAIGARSCALKIAMLAKEVTALETSPSELERSKRAVSLLGMANVNFADPDFSLFEAAEPFDTVFSFPYPELFNDKAREKLFSLAKEHVVCIGFSKYSAPEPIPSILKKKNIEQKSYSEAIAMRDWLISKGKIFSLIKKSGQWKRLRSKEELVKTATEILSEHGVFMEESEILKAAEKFKDKESSDYASSESYSVCVIVCHARK